VRVAPIALLAVLAALAAGCQESGFDERKETARPLKVQHLLGESKVPGQAERPATLGPDTLDNTLALGLVPVAAGLPEGRLPAYLRGPAAEVELLGAGELPPPGADVIVAAAPVRAAEFDALRAIAPTVVTDEGGAPWKLNVRLTGEALGRTNDAEALLSDYDARVARVRRTLPQGARVAVPGAGRESFAAALLADAGVRLVEGRRADATLDRPVWSSPGAIFAARAALADLQDALQK
jgi:ABC-type Fe3+-hydroxamate transport system substrate-binding protein